MEALSSASMHVKAFQQLHISNRTRAKRQSNHLAVAYANVARRATIRLYAVAHLLSMGSRRNIQVSRNLPTRRKASGFAGSFVILAAGASVLLSLVSLLSSE
jgi:hypothetical protein